MASKQGATIPKITGDEADFLRSLHDASMHLRWATAKAEQLATLLLGKGLAEKICVDPPVVRITDLGSRYVAAMALTIADVEREVREIEQLAAVDGEDATSRERNLHSLTLLACAIGGERSGQLAAAALATVLLSFRRE